jgi:hypothetical protein
MNFLVKLLKLHASQWAKLFQENQTEEECTKILRKVIILTNAVKGYFCIF